MTYDAYSFFFFFSEHWKFHIDTKNAKKRSQKVCGFLDNWIWIGNRKFSPLLLQHSQFTINMEKSSPKMSHLIENKLFLTHFGWEWRKSKIKVLFSRFHEFLGLVNTFTAKGFSERSTVMHLNKHIFPSQ